jgi:flagellar motor protein MotB
VFAIRSIRFAVGLILALAGCSSTSSSQLPERLHNSLSTEVQERQVLINRVPAGARLTINSGLLFPADSAQLNERGRVVLNRVIEALFVVQKTPVAVEGCRGGPAIASNCQLLAARVTSVISYLQKQGLDPKLLSVTNGSAPAAAANDGSMREGDSIVMMITWRPVDFSTAPRA